MQSRKEIIELLWEKQFIESEINSMIYGSIEVRTRNEKKYVYVHFRDEGISKTKYVGEFSNDLYNTIILNNGIVRECKKRLKHINKRLDELNYIDENLSKGVKLNIDFAKRNMVDTIYKQAILEGISTTYPDTENLIELGKINNLNRDDVIKIINLKHAWEFILNKNVILSKTDFNLLCEINKFVIEGFYYSAGMLRSTPVKIGGTKWMPNIPIEADVKEKIDIIISRKESAVNIAIELLLYVMKSQIFIDGNKRTAVIFANHYLISHSKGLIVVPENLVTEFKKLLIDYYENNNQKIIEFLKNNCYVALK